MSTKNQHLINRNIQDKERIAAFEGCDGTKGFPALMNSSITPETSFAVGFFMSRKDAKTIEKIKAGDKQQNVAHIHDHDEIYLVFGEADSIEMTVTLGDDTYTLKAPGAVYVPAGLPHSVYISSAVESKFNGLCSVLLNKDYEAKPVPANPLKMETSHLLVRELQVVESVTHHKASEQGFPFIMNSTLVPESKVSYCPYYFLVSEKIAAAAASDQMNEASLHKHHDNEMYLFFGEENAVTMTITLGDEIYQVPNPGVVFIPAELPHGIKFTGAEAGKYGGVGAFLCSPEYYTEDL